MHTSRVLIFAPQGRDAQVASDLLREAGLHTTICGNIVALGDAISDDTSFVVVTEEAMLSADLRAIAARLDAQLPWSDLPFVILTQRGGGLERNPGAARLSGALGNVTFLERPFHPTTFVSVARTAIKGRQRQYEVRARIQELHESEERLQTAMRAGRLGSWELDLNSWKLTASPTFKAVFGRNAEDPFAYSDLISAIHPEDANRMEKAMRDSIANGGDYAIEYRNIWLDGSIHWAEVRARLAFDRLGVNPRLVGVSSDITGRKAAEEDLHHLNETLEERVAMRTSELKQAHADVLEEIEHRERAEEQLRQAQKMEMIGQLTGGVAHDFNNLLMAVISNLDLLRKHVPDDPRSKRLIDGAMQGASRGASLTQRLLAFARRQALEVEPKSLSDLVRGMTELLERSVGPEIELDIKLAATVPLALLDANQVELALLNLVVNARDAMPRGGKITIEVDQAKTSGESDLAAGRYVRLTVLDTGQGMDAETLNRAAEPFFSTKELGKGTGLGLSMIQGLAVQLNGALRLTSKTGIGTRAELWLPATSVAAQQIPAVAAPDEDELTPKATILVVDDDVLIAMSTVDMLEDLGHDVIEANSGASALEILKRDLSIDLLITDYSMPKMTGAQLAMAARELRPDLPILLATGYAELPPDSPIDLPRLGKPYLQNQLATEIFKVLKHRPVEPHLT